MKSLLSIGRIALFTFSALACFAFSAASAAPIITVTGGDDNAPEALGPGLSHEGAAAGFTLGADYTDVSIVIESLLSCSDPCSGDILLYKGTPGPGAAPSNLLAFDTFDSSASSIGFSNIPLLESGAYFLIVGVESGALIWLGSDAPDVTTDGVSFNGADLLVDDVNLTSFLISTFISHEGFFHYSITGELMNSTSPSEVPLPTAAFLFLGGLGALTRFARR